MDIPVIKLDRPMEEILIERIHVFEQNYEMSSAEMARKLHEGEERETAEKLKWMQDYSVLHYLTEKTHTTGTPGTTTGRSTKSALMNTPS